MKNEDLMGATPVPKLIVKTFIPLIISLDDGTGTLKRRKKQSFGWYQKVIASNGEDLE